MRAWGRGDRRNVQWSVRGSTMSSAKRVWPVPLARASTRRRGFPTTFIPAMRPTPSRRTSHRPIRFAASLPVAANSFRGLLDRLEYLEISRAAAKDSGEGLTDLRAGRRTVLIQERLRREEHGRRAVAALSGSQIGEGILKRVEARAVGHPFHRDDLRALALQPPNQAGQNGLAVQENRAGPAFAQLTAMLRPCQSQILPKDLDKRLVRVEGNLERLPVDAERKMGPWTGSRGSRSLGAHRRVPPFRRRFSPRTR